MVDIGVWGGWWVYGFGGGVTSIYIWGNESGVVEGGGDKGGGIGYITTRLWDCRRYRGYWGGVPVMPPPKRNLPGELKAGGEAGAKPTASARRVL